MALIQGFRATDRTKAFILNALATSLIVILSINLSLATAEFVDDTGRVSTQRVSPGQMMTSAIGTFAAAMIVYYAMFFIFGYGGGMLVVN